MDEVVRHIKFGEGRVKKIRDGYIYVQFGAQIKSFQFPDAFKSFLSTNDISLLKKIDGMKTTGVTKSYSKPAEHLNASKSFRGITAVEYGVSRQLVGERAQTISFNTEAEKYFIIGYIASVGRVSSFEAEVPKDGRDKTFEKLFPGQKYRPIEMGDTPSGLPNKLSPQFRINFLNLRNCPPILKNNIGKGNGSCVGRINKSRFVLDLVQNYGFRFGDVQDINKIRKIARERGFIEEFEDGFRK